MDSDFESKLKTLFTIDISLHSAVLIQITYLHLFTPILDSISTSFLQHHPSFSPLFQSFSFFTSAEPPALTFLPLLSRNPLLIYPFFTPSPLLVLLLSNASPNTLLVDSTFPVRYFPLQAAPCQYSSGPQTAVSQQL